MKQQYINCQHTWAISASARITWLCIYGACMSMIFSRGSTVEHSASGQCRADTVAWPSTIILHSVEGTCSWVLMGEEQLGFLFLCSGVVPILCPALTSVWLSVVGKFWRQDWCLCTWVFGHKRLLISEIRIREWSLLAHTQPSVLGLHSNLLVSTSRFEQEQVRRSNTPNSSSFLVSCPFPLQSCSPFVAMASSFSYPLQLLTIPSTLFCPSDT
jgi:hypothetical protein